MPKELFNSLLSDPVNKSILDATNQAKDLANWLSIPFIEGSASASSVFTIFLNPDQAGQLTKELIGRGSIAALNFENTIDSTFSSFVDYEVIEEDEVSKYTGVTQCVNLYIR